jgi:hypothetical protein
VTCPVCFWTNVVVAGGAMPDGGPNGDLSLGDARLNYSIYGASHPRYAQVVRSPRPDELP